MSLDFLITPLNLHCTRTPIQNVSTIKIHQVRREVTAQPLVQTGKFVALGSLGLVGFEHFDTAVLDPRSHMGRAHDQPNIAAQSHISNIHVEHLRIIFLRDPREVFLRRKGIW